MRLTTCVVAGGLMFSTGVVQAQHPEASAPVPLLTADHELALDILLDRESDTELLRHRESPSTASFLALENPAETLLVADAVWTPVLPFKLRALEPALLLQSTTRSEAVPLMKAETPSSKALLLPNMSEGEPSSLAPPPPVRLLEL